MTRDWNLRYAASDATGVVDAFQKARLPGGQVHALAFVDEQARHAALAPARDFVAKSHVGDTVVVFFAGHGTHTNDAGADYFVALNETDVHRLRETGLPLADLSAILGSAPARRRLLLLESL